MGWLIPGGSVEVNLAIESIHAAIRARELAGTVAIGEHRSRRVIENVLVGQRHRFQGHPSALGILAVGDGIGTRIALEEIVEAPAPLHDEDATCEIFPAPVPASARRAASCCMYGRPARVREPQPPRASARAAAATRVIVRPECARPPAGGGRTPALAAP